MKTNSAQTGAAIERARAWLSFRQCRSGIDPLLADYSTDLGEVYLVLLTVSLPGRRAAEPYDMLARTFERISKVSTSSVKVQIFADLEIHGLRRPVLPVLFQTQLGRTDPLLQQALTSFRKEANVPPDEETYPHAPLLFGVSWPAEAAWCLHNLIMHARYRKAELREQEQHYLVHFMNHLAQERVRFGHLANELHAVGQLVLRYEIPTWAAWQKVAQRDSPSFARALEPLAVAGLLRREAEDQEEYLAQLVTTVYDQRRQELAALLEKIRERPETQFASLHADKLVEAVVLDRVIGTQLMTGGGHDIGQTVRSFDISDPEDADTDEVPRT